MISTVVQPRCLHDRQYDRIGISQRKKFGPPTSARGIGDPKNISPGSTASKADTSAAVVAGTIRLAHAEAERDLKGPGRLWSWAGFLGRVAGTRNCK
jgi:hypothetical protein